MTQATGGVLASAIESGFTTLLQDVWNVIVGPLQIAIGVAIGIAVLAIYFKNDIAGAVAMAAVA